MFIDIVSHLRPKFVLMENVVDLVKFAGDFLSRYAMGCLVGMGYQARMGTMVAGAYGLPRFHMCVFLWGIGVIFLQINHMHTRYIPIISLLEELLYFNLRPIWWHMKKGVNWI